jgi:hypothetical protein
MGIRIRGCVERATPAKIDAAERASQGTGTQESPSVLSVDRRQARVTESVLRRRCRAEGIAGHRPRELAKELRELENLRLDAMFAAVYPMAIKGDVRAVDTCLRIMTRRAAINGLDAPRGVRQAVITEEDILRAIAAVEAETGRYKPQCGPVGTRAGPFGA